MNDELFHFNIINGILLVSDSRGILYCSNINRVFSDLNGSSFEIFIYNEIVKHNDEIIMNKFEFCKCFLNFVKEMNQ